MLLRLAPWLFVVLWSTGYIASKVGAEHAEPFTFLTLRFMIVLALLVPIVWFSGGRIPPWRDFTRAVLAGAVIHAVYLAGILWALRAGMPAGVAALVVSLQPIVTALLSGPLIGERVLARHWAGLVTGLAGAMLVLAPKTDLVGAAGIGPWSIAACLGSLTAITAGTLFQKACCAHIDLRSAALPQYLGALTVAAVGALAFETREVNWTPELWMALLWLAVALSIGAIGLLMLLIRENAVWRTSALFYLVPPTTAVMAWALFSETLTLVQVGGLVLVCAAVVMIEPSRRRT